jgi:hypothetical protein
MFNTKAEGCGFFFPKNLKRYKVRSRRNRIAKTSFIIKKI